METGSALTYLLDTTVERDMSAVGKSAVPRQGDVLSYVRHYAQATATRSMAASIALTLANFQKFLVLSACAVLLEEEEVSPAEVLTVAKLSVNELIDKLNLHGWGYRSSELLLVWNRTPAFYFLLMSSSRSALEYIVQKLTQEAFSGHTMSSRPWTPIFVPSIVNHILGYKVP
ncbi:hypothetical protein LTS14_010186 [Recurvomyces mirabilis]|uniref:uncharacterized protein n=1 Tax=Recurvomyces mirabilis TaxID=574656 RepID=UPI002DDF4EFF|nr:hypothetical protein LTS14_010186 [Recurvomyces mirabilis]